MQVPPGTPSGAPECPGWLQAQYTGVPGDPAYDHAGKIAAAVAHNQCDTTTASGTKIDRYAVTLTVAEGEVAFDYWIGVYLKK
jgi:hypothetical protein